MTEQVNRQWLLASRPHGVPTSENFDLVSSPVPTIEQNQVLLQNVYLSLDPYMRGRMNDAESYAEPVALNEVMVGATISKVVESNHGKFSVGDWVLSYSGWQDYAVSNGDDLTPLGQNPAYPSYALGVMGMPGFTAYMGLLDIGQPKAGDTLVVGAATGAVGSIVGQIAKLKGCRVIGVAGGNNKCSYAVEELGFDACLDHYADNFSEQLAQVCEQGIDIYYENIGGKVFQAVLPLLNVGARIPVCGLIAHYNDTQLPEGPDRSPQLMATLLIKRIKMQGFIIFDDYGHRYGEFAQQMEQWLKEGKIKYKEDRVIGMEQTAQTFIGLLSGKNFGKVVVQLSPDTK